MNRVTGVTDVFGQVIDYNYDPNGNRTKLTLNAAVVATYRYDAIDQLTKILDAANATFNFAYDATNKITSRNAPNGVTATYQYDGLDRLTGLTNKKDQTTIADFQYQFNDANNISQITDLASTNNYSYDAVDRLTASTHSNQPNEDYSYNSVGNRTSSHLSATYGYQPFNRLVSTTSTTYTYDTNGNLISKTDASGTTQYTWDFENRVKQVTLPNGNIVIYKHDALGRRIERSATVGSPLPLTTTERFIYDGVDVIRDMDANGVTLADYLNGPGIDNKLRQTTLTAALYFVQDHLGSTRALTDALGNVVEQQQYDSFGNSAGSALTRYGYTGRERDADTGLFYYRARWYDPQVGRFISEDPIGLEGGINLYGYVANNPINSIDPLGLQSRPKKAGAAEPAPASSCDPCNDPSNWDTRLSDARQIASSLGWQVNNDGKLSDNAHVPFNGVARRLAESGFERFLGNISSEHRGGWDYEGQINGRWYHITVMRPAQSWIELLVTGKAHKNKPPPRIDIHCERYYYKPSGVAHVWDTLFGP